MHAVPTKLSAKKRNTCQAPKQNTTLRINMQLKTSIFLKVVNCVIYVSEKITYFMACEWWIYLCIYFSYIIN
jgi:hypothetical protein